MTKKEQYIQLRVAGKSRSEVREIMGFNLKSESVYAARLSEEIENRKRLRELPPDAKLDGTPKLTPAEAEHRIAETLGLIERRVEPAQEGHAVEVADPAPVAEPATEPMTAGPTSKPELPTPAERGPIVIVGRYMEFSLDMIGTRCRGDGVEFRGTLAEYGAAIAAEMAAVDRALRGIRL